MISRHRKNEIVKKFSDEVEKQIDQFGTDLIEDISSQIDEELDAQQKVLGLTHEQVDVFRVVLQAARQRVLAKYQLHTKNTRTDTPYPGVKHR